MSSWAEINNCCHIGDIDSIPVPPTHIHRYVFKEHKYAPCLVIRFETDSLLIAFHLEGPLFTATQVVLLVVDACELPFS